MEIEVKNEGKYEDNLITSNDIDLEKENHEAVKDKFENQDTIPGNTNIYYLSHFMLVI